MNKKQREAIRDIIPFKLLPVFDSFEETDRSCSAVEDKIEYQIIDIIPYYPRQEYLDQIKMLNKKKEQIRDIRRKIEVE